MSTIILPIHSNYVESIFKGTKLFEFRKFREKLLTVEKILICQVKPFNNIVGSFEVKRILTTENWKYLSEDDDTFNDRILSKIKLDVWWQMEAAEIWDVTKEYAGISEKEFRDYYSIKIYDDMPLHEQPNNYYSCDTEIIVFKIGNVTIYDNPVNIENFGLKRPPQNYVFAKIM